MATAKTLSALRTLAGDPTTPKKPAPPTIRSKPRPLTDEELVKFGNFGDTGDTKEKAKYLMNKGLRGAEQMYTDHPDISTREGILNAQSDWKAAVLSQMLQRARRAGLKTPTEIKANRVALIQSLHPKYQEAINHPAFSQIHPNWWETFDSVLSDRYAAEAATQPLSSLSTSLAKK